MAHTALTPVFVGLRTGLHVLFAALTVLVIARAVLAPTDTIGAVIALAIIVLLTYGFGAVLARPTHGRDRLAGRLWLVVLSTEWIALLWLTPEAAYLVFPLFFLYLHVLGRWWGSSAILVSTVISIFALGLHGGFTVGGVVGPLVGAGVALLIGLGYQALARESAEREALMRELLATRGQLAATEHESGVLAERARLARETAAANLADARRFIRELTPPELDDHGLGGALRRLADSQWKAQGLDVQIRVADSIALPMHLQTALLRIAQGAIANVIQHANAEHATVSLTTERDALLFSVIDDGSGFDVVSTALDGAGTSDSFGLQATRERVQQLGGTLDIDSAPGRGTTLAITLALETAL